MGHYELDLDHQLDRSVEWVKYAETKNGVALGLLAAAFIGTCNANCWKSGWSGKILIVVLALQLGLLIWSFIPRFSSPLCIKKEKECLNFHYYGDIASVSLLEFRTKLKAAYANLDENSKCFMDVTHQIHVNCEIAMKKFILFKWTCYLTVLSGLSFIFQKLM